MIHSVQISFIYNAFRNVFNTWETVLYSVLAIRYNEIGCNNPKFDLTQEIFVKYYTSFIFQSRKAFI